jgi:hypothetical protein
MKHKKTIVYALFGISLILFAVQAGIWWRTASHAHNETEKQRIEILHPPNEAAGLAGTCFLLAAAVLASMPQRHTSRRSHT